MKCFCEYGPGDLKLLAFFFFVTLVWAKFARVPVPDRLSQPSILFTSKVRANPSEVTFRCSTL
jgi:hypothetical protein